MRAAALAAVAVGSACGQHEARTPAPSPPAADLGVAGASDARIAAAVAAAPPPILDAGAAPGEADDRFGAVGVGSGSRGHGPGTIGLGHGVSGDGAARGRHPALGLGAPTVAGDGLSAELIRRFLKRRASAVTACYEQRLQAVPTLAGTVTAHFTINDHGKVVDATATGVDAALDACIVSVLQAIEFPSPTVGTVAVTWPFVFAPPA